MSETIVRREWGWLFLPGAIALALALAGTACAPDRTHYTLDQLEGAWWSDSTAPTAAFAIHNGEIWLDVDAEYHAASLAGDTLVYDLGSDIGIIRRHIISLAGDTLVLQTLWPGATSRTIYVRR